MTKCIITDSQFIIYNPLCFVEINNDNKVSFGYLMEDNDISEKARERIALNIPFVNRVAALEYALEYAQRCETFCHDFDALEDYIHAEEKRLSILAEHSARTA